MVLRVSSNSARQTRRRIASGGGGGNLWHTTYMGTNRNIRGAPGRSAEDDRIPDAGTLYPMAHLVEQDPDCVFKAHFHQADQFQVVVAGNGWLGTHALTSVAVHYTNAYTPYGPITSGHAGLHYFTLRNGWDPGARHLPGASAELRGVKRSPRQAIGDIVPMAPIELAASTKPSAVEVLPLEADGLGAWLHRLPSGKTAIGPDPGAGGGQYWVVLAGTLQEKDVEALEALSCAFVFPGDEAFEARAGDGGLEILCLQFPARSTH